ncbi:MAG: tRNA uridine-5-carboxymethylaminomethyl(34) synthesis GTPase MnmE [Betaproteobacteria bacterium]|nr:tRNA uridine-5-carboxymethylaminomethyl(34) synthesis GTPase MnmE [Betaproteobacteria bacterium]MDH3437499.1 tRNA uridine-5-carboxymethylaminomethyl(34) synthesis GTPase MnmE [Betaproteobacteria bacterium]
MSRSDIIAAIATAPGRAGIGIVRVSGPRLGEFAVALVGRRLPSRHAILADVLDARQQVIDYGLALYFPAPHSYTGEDVLELQGHGGPVVLQLVLRRCLELGARLAEPGEFTRRAFLNDKLDLAQAESVADLIDASTARAARCALRSLQGAFSERIETLVRGLTELRLLVEATLDFPEEDVEILERAGAEQQLAALRVELSRIEQASQQGSLLREGMHIVLAGQPNVGKSSLLNRLAGEELAIVTEIPGTTRDAIRQKIDLDGVPAHIIDTAGLRESSDPVEGLGIARTWAAIEKADLVLLIMDCITGETAADRLILDRLPSALPRVKVMNKIDLTGHHAAKEGQDGTAVVWLSAKTGEGVDLLRSSLLEAVGWKGGAEGLFMARERHLGALSVTRRHLEHAQAQLGQSELFAEELRLAQAALGTITGEVTPDDLLGEIFSRFCIGK